MSITKSQISALVEGWLDAQAAGLDPSSSANVDEKLSILEQAIDLFRASFLQDAIANIQAANKVDSGALDRDLKALSTYDATRGVYTIFVGYLPESPAADYYDFVNKGVQGVTDNSRAPESPYKFRTVGVGLRLEGIIEAWLQRHGAKMQVEDQRHNLSNHQRKIQSVGGMANEEKQMLSLAFLVGRSIKRRGLTATHYFDKAYESTFGSEFADALASIIGAEVRLNVRQLNNIQNGTTINPTAG